MKYFGVRILIVLLVFALKNSKDFGVSKCTKYEFVQDLKSLWIPKLFPQPKLGEHLIFFSLNFGDKTPGHL